MSNLIINSLMIFEPSTNKAKRVDFGEGINIITASQKDGNDKGKSMIMKSLYHTLGADSIFDDGWKLVGKIYLLNISIDSKKYFFYRSEKLFKVFDNSFKLLFKTINRTELSVFLSQLYHFKVLLPNRDDDELELAPPAFSYILNYIDQDYMDGSHFHSFERLGQYLNFKENLLFNHFGIFDDDYYSTMKKLEDLRQAKLELQKEYSTLEEMLKKINGYLEGINAPDDLKALEIEISRKKEEYAEIVHNLSKIKNNLIKIRNEKFDLQKNIELLIKSKKKEESHLKSVNNNICPMCSNEINDISLTIKINNDIEDYYVLRNHLDELMLKVDRKITLETEKYGETLKRLKLYEDQLKISNKAVSDVIKHKGYIKTQSKFIDELNSIKLKLVSNNTTYIKLDKVAKEYNKKKKSINEYYKLLMTESKSKFNLQELSIKKFDSIKNNIGARGSNIPIATIIWYFNLLKVKYKFNPDVIKFPLVLDSPNNVELDDTKREALFNYVFEGIESSTQLIVSTIGFSESMYPDTTFDKVITLKNEDYHLLNESDYYENIHILDDLLTEQ